MISHPSPLHKGQTYSFSLMGDMARILAVSLDVRQFSTRFDEGEGESVVLLVALVETNPHVALSNPAVEVLPRPPTRSVVGASIVA